MFINLKIYLLIFIRSLSHKKHTPSSSFQCCEYLLSIAKCLLNKPPGCRVADWRKQPLEEVKGARWRARESRVKVHFVIYHGPSSSISGIATGSTFIYKGRGELYSGAAACWIIQFRLFLSLLFPRHFRAGERAASKPSETRLAGQTLREIFTARVMINKALCALTHTNLFWVYRDVIYCASRKRVACGKYHTLKLSLKLRHTCYHFGLASLLLKGVIFIM